MAPFMLTELRNKVPIRIQKARERMPCDTVAPLSAGFVRTPAWALSWGRSRTKRAVSGSPRSSTSDPRTKYAARQPYPAINVCAIGGNTIAPVPTPAITNASAKPRRRSNQVTTARE